MDGGVRRGTDVLKALALGARAVCIGRPYLWALAADGEEGVRDVLRILQRGADAGHGAQRPAHGRVDRPLAGAAVTIDRTESAASIRRSALRI